MKRFRNSNDCNFGELLSEVDWSAITGRLDEDQNNVTSAYQSFFRFQQIYSHCFPIALLYSRSRTPRNEWITTGLLVGKRTSFIEILSRI